MNRLRICLRLMCMLLLAGKGHAQSAVDHAPVIALLSDTQAPLPVERLFYGDHRNTLATRKIFDDIITQRPGALLILGDVVSIGYQESRWTRMDRYLDSVRGQNIHVWALLGNHDLMIAAAKGEAAFRKRFPDMKNTGFVKMLDSIAFVMLNSNFKQLTSAQEKEQGRFCSNILEQLDTDDAVKCIVVCCHHAPYSNSQVVGSSKQVQEHFLAPFLRTKKAKLFITGHAHDFEHFIISGKDFLTIGGGGGVHQPLNKGAGRIPSESFPYDPEFHYLLMQRQGNSLLLVSRRLLPDFSGFENGYRFTVQ